MANNPSPIRDEALDAMRQNYADATGPEAEDVRYLIARIEEQAKEIERLTEALRKVENVEVFGIVNEDGDDRECSQCIDRVEIARAALQGKG